MWRLLPTMSDKEFITSIMQNDRVWDSVRVDGVTKEQFGYCESSEYFVNKHGFVMFRTVTPSMMELHVCMLKCKNTKEFVEECMEKMRNKGTNKFLAPIGDWNKSALKLGKRLGLIEEGRIANAYIRDGKFHSMVLMGSKL